MDSKRIKDRIDNLSYTVGLLFSSNKPPSTDGIYFYKSLFFGDINKEYINIRYEDCILTLTYNEIHAEYFRLRFLMIKFGYEDEDGVMDGLYHEIKEIGERILKSAK